MFGKTPEMRIRWSPADTYVCPKSASLYDVTREVEPSPQSIVALNVPWF